MPALTVTVVHSGCCCDAVTPVCLQHDGKTLVSMQPWVVCVVMKR